MYDFHVKSLLSKELICKIRKGYFTFINMKNLPFVILLVVAGCSSKTSSESTSENADSLLENATKMDSSISEDDELTLRAKEEEAVYNGMGAYDGTYALFTESEGATGTLSMQYLDNRTFKFSLQLIVADMCNGIVEDTAYVDRTQHAFYRTNGCMLHFELQGQNIEITAEDGCDKMKGDCSFSGVYQSVADPD